MNIRTLALLAAASQLFLWFMPFVNIEPDPQMLELLQLRGLPDDTQMYQSGQHIGGIAYLMLISAASYAVTSWKGLKVPSIVCAGLGSAVSVLLVIGAGSNIAWGLSCLLLAQVLGMLLATRLQPAEVAHTKGSS